MDERVISAANLDAIEENLSYVGRELSGVINNVNNFNEQISGIEENIASLNNELGEIVKEIRSTTVINNARQTIMYNNEQIEKKYGYFNIVRRRTESLLQAVETSNISKKSLLKAREELLLNNPNYWLSSALVALISWLINDKENAQKELHNAMSKNREKTSVFFCLVYLKLGRIDTAINWLNSYLNNEDPTNLSKDFITILDLVSNNQFGSVGKLAIIDKINVWFNRLSGSANIGIAEKEKWIKYIKSKENQYIALPYLEVVSKEVDTLRNNLQITSSYNVVTSELKYITDKKYESKSLDEILNNLIYEYEDEEQTFQKENAKNQLIIENDGDREKAMQIYENEKTIYEENNNILSLLNNIVIYSDKYLVNDETRKLALSLVKNNILAAYDEINGEINRNNFHIGVEDFSIEINDGFSNQYADNKIKEYVEKTFYMSDSKSIIILAIINIATIIGMAFTINIPWLTILLACVLLIFDAYYSYTNIISKHKMLNKQKKEAHSNLSSILERAIAESIDYKNILKQYDQNFEELKNYLNSINYQNYVRSNDERSITIDEH